MLGPRLVVAGTSSGVGKTTVATGLMAALARRGLAVGAAKVGPDYIDTGYHAMATGRPSRNLDAWICGAEAMAPLATRAAAGSDILVIEGVMGLFDGAAEDGSASTAHVARLLAAPVVLVVDAAAMSGSVAALVHGFATFDRSVPIAGVILNRVGGEGHDALLRQALAPLGMPVLGALRRDDDLVWRDRHLGLVPVVEHRQAVAASLGRLADAIARGCDLDRLVALARTAGERTVAEPPRARASGCARVALATGPAFSFVYPDNLEALEQAGAELVPFDPIADAALPTGCTGLYAGGGFPEVFGAALSANEPLRRDVGARIGRGLITWAECGGLLWLSRSLDQHPMIGAIAADSRMTGRLSLGYRRAVVRRPTPVAGPGEVLRGHEFHYSAVEPAGDGLDLSGQFGSGVAGHSSPSLLATYLHLHLGGDPTPAERFVAAAASAVAR
ncbi:MAG: cobyrinate a,c-diamide synthase [Actinomycetota bacterium]|nr:cobyrinate a,c-diamide synthase [Actinomycetota bacterium]